jgi:hypothetical protein
MEHLSMWQMAYRPGIKCAQFFTLQNSQLIQSNAHIIRPVSQIRNETVSIYEANYPENLRRIFIINGIINEPFVLAKDNVIMQGGNELKQLLNYSPSSTT